MSFSPALYSWTSGIGAGGVPRYLFSQVLNLKLRSSSRSQGARPSPEELEHVRSFFNYANRAKRFFSRSLPRLHIQVGWRTSTGCNLYQGRNLLSFMYEAYRPSNPFLDTTRKAVLFLYVYFLSPFFCRLTFMTHPRGGDACHWYSRVRSQLCRPD